MKRLAGKCRTTKAKISGHDVVLLVVDIAATGDEAVAIDHVFLCRKGINAFPEFAAGFGWDPSTVVAGLPPENYQFRLELMLLHDDRMSYADERNQFDLPPGRHVSFAIPVPFKSFEYFVRAPADDIFVLVRAGDDEGRAVEMPTPHGALMQIMTSFTQEQVPIFPNVNINLVLPHSSMPSEAETKMVGKTNPKPILPMPNN